MTTAGPKANAGKGLLSVWNDYDPAAEDFYELWYMTEHFPERRGVPGFLRGRRYTAIDADRKYFTFYDLESPDVMFSDAYLARLNAPTEWTRRAMSRWSAMFRTVCGRVIRTGDAVGGFVIVARFEAPARLDAVLGGELQRNLDDTSIVAVDIWSAAARQNDPTVESSNRSEPDHTICGAVVVEASSARNLKALTARLATLLRPMSDKPPVIGTYQLIALQSVDG